MRRRHEKNDFCGDALWQNRLLEHIQNRQYDSILKDLATVKG